MKETEKDIETKIEQMLEEKFNCNNKKCTHGHYKMHGRGHNGASNSGLYCMGMIGAAIYFIGQAPDFWAGVVGFLKAMVWPAIMVYEAFRVLLG